MTEQRELEELGSAVSGTGAIKLGALAAAFIAAKAEMKPLIASNTATVPTKSGGQYKYTYSNLAEVYDVCEEALGKHGIAVWQDVYTYRDKERPEVECYTLLYHAESDQYRTCGRITMQAAMPNPTPQEVGSLITYARRYSLLAAVGLAPEDDDGSSASQRTSAPQPARQQNGTRPTNGAKPANGTKPTNDLPLADQLETLGTELYGDGWPSTLKHNLAKFGEDKTEVAHLTADELQRLVKGLKAVKAQREAQPA